MEMLTSRTDRHRAGEGGRPRPTRDDHAHHSWAARLLGPFAGPRTKFLTVLVAILVSGAAFAFAGQAEETQTATTPLPAEAQSAQVARIRATLPASGTAPAIAVFTAKDGGTLDQADRQAVAEAQRRVVAADEKRAGPPPQPSENGTATLLVIPLPSDLSDEAVVSTVDELRSTLRDGLSPELQVAVTGGPAFSADLGKVFDGADTRLLAATAGVVALLLLVTYRSPWLWLVPLTVVGVGDQVANKAVTALSQVSDVQADGAVTGITSVLVFGAGTNYALLLIARYREELRRTEDRHTAMRLALSAAAPAILASGGTVALALVSLGLADDPFTESLGYAGALGIVVALAYALLVLPAAMVLFGRGLFWPFVPRVGQADPTERGVWSRVGAAVTGRPLLVGAAGVLLLAGLASGLSSLRIGLSPTEQFLEKPEAVVGQQQLAKAFPAGTSDPAVVVGATDRAERVQAAAEGVDGVVSVRRTAGDDRVTELSVVLAAEPGTPEAFSTVRELRAAVAQVPGADAKVGGSDAELLDSRTTAERDRAVLVPVILGIVLVVLLVLLRSPVAAVVLVLTVVATYAASMGASWWAFDHLFGFPAMEVSTPLLAFLFLVALGVDYNIFLTTRAREEAADGAPARPAIVRALAVTGGVITSAGILLAAVFAVLGVLPLIQLAQIGVIVGFGVLLDTLLVRSVLVPALVSLFGERFWWPSHPAVARR